MAVDFLRSELGVPVSQILPYPAMLVPLTYFFHQIKNKKASAAQRALLEQFFYWAGSTSRYSSAAESKVGEDLKKMALIAKGKAPKYAAAELVVDAQTIQNTWFSAGNAFCKTVICLLAAEKPRSLDTHGDVILDNSNLKIASSKNYHHFFPKDYLRKQGSGYEANWIANIALIDAYSNKHRIGAKAPSVYIGEFMKNNPKLKAGLRTHFIENAKTYGVLDDDYETFLAKRAALIAAQLTEKLRPAL